MPRFNMSVKQNRRHPQAAVGSGDSGVGNVAIRGEGSTWNTNDLFLGSSDGLDDRGIGNVLVESGGQLLIGNDHQASVESQLIVSDTAFNSELAVRNGSTIDHDGVATVGRSANSSGAVLLTGENSRWDNAGELVIGSSGNGTLSIENGATMKAGGIARVGQNEGSTGIATVSSSDSVWDIETGLAIGPRGTATVNIEDQGRVTVGDAVLFSLAGSSEARITGAGSQLQVDIALDLGGPGKTRLFVENGGLASSGRGFLSGVDTIATISGSNSRWENTDSLTVATDGTLIVEDAGFVAGGSISIGSIGNGELRIENQGAVSSGGGFVGRHGNGQVTITGANSNWDMSQKLACRMGQ